MEERIAYFIPDMRSGGAERSTLIDVNRDVAAGLNVDLVLRRAEGTLLSELDNRISVIDLGSARFFSSITAFAEYLKEKKPTIVYSQMIDSGLAAVAARSLSKHECKIVSTIRTTLSAQAREVERLSPKGIKRWIARKAAVYVHRKHVDEIRAVSEGVASDFAEFTGIPRSRISVLKNHRDPQELRRKASNAISHKWFDGNTKVVIGVGRLHHAKGFDRLILAFSSVRKEIDCKLVILGEGEARQELETLISKLGLSQDIDLAGFVENPYPFMARSSVFVLSSRREGFPGVLLEANLLGVKTVAVDCKSGPREILKNGELGTLVEEDNAEALVSAIKGSLLSN